MTTNEKEMREEAKEIVQLLRSAGHEALFAGGCVRDLLRGIPAKDYDVATSATPEEVLSIFPRGNTIGAHFGVVLVRRGGHDFEIATFRQDGSYGDGRHPDSVTYTTAENDAQRRDFTVNGMFYDPIAEEVIDYVGGQADLESGVLRAIGEPAERFREDYLRMLRAIRFATMLDFEIEAGTFAALRENASKVTEISPERIRAELDRIWLSPNRVRGFDLLVESGLMAEVLPEILNLQGCEQPPQWHPEGDVFVHTRLMLGLLKPDATLPLVLSVLFHDIAKPATFAIDEEAGGRIRFNGHEKVGADMTEEILKRFRYSNEVSEAAITGVANHMRFKDVQKMRTSTLKRFMNRPTFEDEMELHRVDCQSSNGMVENYEFLRQKEEEFANAPLVPEPFVKGADLIERGWKPSPEMGAKLREIQDLQLDGTITSREEALALLDDA